MNNVFAAEGMAWLLAGGEALPVSVSIGKPIERSWADWTVRVTVTVGEESQQYEAPGANSLQAMFNGLAAAAVEVNRLRGRGRVSREGFPWDYFCLDELDALRRPTGICPPELIVPLRGRDRRSGTRAEHPEPPQSRAHHWAGRQWTRARHTS